MNQGPTTHSRIAWAKWLPILAWGRAYDGRQLGGDLLAAGIVTLMLIPQSLAYAMLAGLPPQAGLYASMLPLLAYAVFGSSRTLAVGPAAVTSLMTATAIGQLAAPGTPAYWEAALALALLSGGILLVMGLLRLGFLANFLGHPVIAGFISASGLLIAFGQARHVLGVSAHGDTLLELLPALWHQLPMLNWPTLMLGGGALLFLWWSRQRLGRRLRAWGWRSGLVDVLGRAAPVLAIALTTLAVWAWNLQDQGVKVVGAVPQGLPSLTWPTWNPALWSSLAMPALLLSLVGFAESVSVGQTLAARRRQRVEPDQELLALGASNVAAAVSGGLPVTGGFSRSVVNFDAGARTPAAGVYTAIGIALAALLLTPLLRYLPQATLAATVIVAVLSLVDIAVFRRIWRYSRFDFSVAAATLALTLLAGVETGLVAGVVLALALHLYRSSRPHVAEVGQVPGTEHFRNVRRHAVNTCEAVLGLRVDESLYFANARYLEDCINDAVARRQQLKHVVLQCSAINDIDASALASLEMIEVRLREAGICLHLSEVKGPVMDRLSRTSFLQCLSGQVFLTHYQAIAALAPEGLGK
ncbi:SulP family inorganic anion transporter [Kerstersia similis]|uniref:SulP family inorganic anion transporter n=1 Tax=Kerstersia similis TaxID=206505 RepID=UPI0039EEAFBB